MSQWLDPDANTRADRAQPIILASLACLGLALVLGIMAGQDFTTGSPPNIMPCPEDSALVWVDAPHTARCIALDDWADAASLARLHQELGR